MNYVTPVAPPRTCSYGITMKGGAAPNVTPPPPPPPRISSKPQELRPAPAVSVLDKLIDIVDNRGEYDEPTRDQAARQIIASNAPAEREYIFAATQIMRNFTHFNENEIVSAINFIFQHYDFFKPKQLIYSAKKMINYHINYSEQVERGLLTVDAPHFENEDLARAAQVFIYINNEFFKASPEEVRQFLTYASDKVVVVHNYRDSLFDMLRMLGLEKKALALWEKRKFVKAPALHVEISLFILKNTTHEVFPLWNDFVHSKVSSSQSSSSNLY